MDKKEPFYIKYPYFQILFTLLWVPVGALVFDLTVFERLFKIKTLTTLHAGFVLGLDLLIWIAGIFFITMFLKKRYQ